MAGRLEGRVAFITGGASGIGRGCCLRFAEEGADIAVADYNESGAGETAGMVEALGRKALALKLDVTDEEAVEGAVSEAANQLGKVDACVAAAGIYLGAGGSAPEAFVVDRKTEDWQRVIDVNLNGVMYTDRAVARRMIAAGGGGTIVNIASGAAAVPIRRTAEYCVSKAGVLMLTKCLALELAPYQVRVNSIGPGLIETPMTEALRSNEERLAAFLRGTPLARTGQPLDIANTALFLSNDESSYFTGQILFPVGGAFMG
jgi:glucose 1-dehydrogenase